MPDRSLIVRILGDPSSLKNAYNESVRATKNFGNVQEQETRREEKNLLRLKTKRAQSLGPLRIAAAGLGAGAAVFAGIQGLRALADGLKVSGDEAFTTTGRIRNLAAELASGNIVGAFQALTSQESRIAPDLEKAVQHLKQMRDEASRVSLADVVSDSARFRGEAAAIEKELVKIGLPIEKATARTAEWRKELQAAAAATVDIVGPLQTAVAGMVKALEDAPAKAITARKQGLERIAQLPPGITAAITREQGPEGNQAKLLKTLREADANLVRRIEEMRQQGKGRDVSEGLAKLQAERNSIDSQITGIFKARADAIEEQRQAAEDALRKQKQATEAAVRAQREGFAAQLGFLEIRLDRARVTSGLQDDLRELDRQEQAVRAQIQVEGRTVELERQLLAIEQERGTIAQQRKERAVQRRDAAQFRSLGLGATGDELIPSKEALARQLKQVTAGIEGTVLDTGKNDRMLKAIRKLVFDPFSKVSDEVRETIARLLDDLQGQFDKAAGPLTKTSGLNTKEIADALGLGPAKSNELRSLLSGFNTAGRALAGAGATATTGGGRIGPGGPIIVESHTTIQLDSDVVARAVTRSQQKGRRRNPPQKRGPNRIGGV